MRERSRGKGGKNGEAEAGGMNSDRALTLQSIVITRYYNLSEQSTIALKKHILHTAQNGKSWEWQESWQEDWGENKAGGTFL
eukprot:Skav216112  [mRNA]  locus=scaffold1946:118304:119342:+ [translate_table: standard]